MPRSCHAAAALRNKFSVLEELRHPDFCFAFVNINTTTFTFPFFFFLSFCLKYTELENLDDLKVPQNHL